MSRDRPASIRAADRSDEPPVVDLLEKEGLESTFVAQEFLVAEDRDEVVGCARLAPLEGGLFELASVAVRPARRGEGIGQALVRRALGDVEETVHALCLQPDFFQSLGFEETDEVHPRLEDKAEACCADRDFVPMTWRPGR